MSDLFRLSATHRTDPAVAAWFDEHATELGRLARSWFGTLRASGTDVREAMHDGCATVCLDDAAFAYVGVYKAHVSIGFFRGAELPDSGGLLEGTGKFMRHVKLRPDRPIDAGALEELIAAAHADMKARLEPGSRKSAPVPSAR